MGKLKKSIGDTSRIVRYMWYAFGGIVVLVVAAFAMIAWGWIGYMPPIEDMENPKDKFASEIYSSDMEVIGRFYQSKSNRVYVHYDEISPYLVNALIATEDIRFKDHSGIDVKALFRAFIKRGLLFQKSAGGGSTITQQLAKLLYSPNADNVVERLFQKPQEWVIAVQLERFYTKEEIVNMYLNHFDFLNNAVGIQSAAYIYFHTTPDKLKIEEAATLVGMCKNPSYYNPRRFNERTRGRRNTVLNQMYKAKYITKAELDSLQALPLALKYTRVDHKEGLAPYFREQLRLMMTAKKPVKSEYRGWEAQKFIDDSTAWANNPLYGWCEKNTKKDGSKYKAWRCQEAAKHGSPHTDKAGNQIGCTGASIRNEDATHIMFLVTKELKLRQTKITKNLTSIIESIIAMDTTGTDIEKLKTQIATIEDKRTKLIDIYMSGDISKDEFSAARSKCDAEIAELQSVIDSIDKQQAMIRQQQELVQEIRDAINEIVCGVEYDDEFYKHILDKMVVNDKDNIDVYLNLLPMKWSYTVAKASKKALAPERNISGASVPISVRVPLSSGNGIANR